MKVNHQIFYWRERGVLWVCYAIGNIFLSLQAHWFKIEEYRI